MDDEAFANLELELLLEFVKTTKPAWSISKCYDSVNAPLCLNGPGHYDHYHLHPETKAVHLIVLLKMNTPEFWDEFQAWKEAKDG